MDSRARAEPVKRNVKLTERVVLSPRLTKQVTVAYVGELPADRDLLFEPLSSLQLG